MLITDPVSFFSWLSALSSSDRLFFLSCKRARSARSTPPSCASFQQSINPPVFIFICTLELLRIKWRVIEQPTQLSVLHPLRMNSEGRK